MCLSQMFSFDHIYVVITLQEKNRVYGIEMPLKGGQQRIIENIKTATVKEYHENKTMVLIHRTNYDFFHFSRSWQWQVRPVGKGCLLLGTWFHLYIYPWTSKFWENQTSAYRGRWRRLWRFLPFDCHPQCRCNVHCHQAELKRTPVNLIVGTLFDHQVRMADHFSTISLVTLEYLLPQCSWEWRVSWRLGNTCWRTLNPGRKIWSSIEF